jgi:hypothetical protein
MKSILRIRSAQVNGRPALEGQGKKFPRYLGLTFAWRLRHAGSEAGE